MRAITLGEMMTSPVRTLNEHDLLSSADWDMINYEIRHLPVVDRANHVVGMVSDRDVLRAAIRSHREHVPVSEIMTSDVYVCLPSTPALEVAEHMLRSKYGAVPVVDAQRKLVGIVTSTDFIALAHRALAGLDIGQPHTRA